MSRRFEGGPDGKRPRVYAHEYFVNGRSVGWRCGPCPGGPPSPPDPLEGLEALEAATREAARDDVDDTVLFELCERFQELATPAVVLALIEEVRRLRGPLPAPPGDALVLDGWRLVAIHPDVYREVNLGSFGGARLLRVSDVERVFRHLAGGSPASESVKGG